MIRHLTEWRKFSRHLADLPVAVRLTRHRPTDRVPVAWCTSSTERGFFSRTLHERFDMAGQWHYQHDGQKYGPVPAAELKRLATVGKLTPTDMVRREDTEKWVPAGQVKGLFAVPVATPQRFGEQVQGSRQRKSVGEVEPLPLPEEEEEVRPHKSARRGKAHSPPALWAKATSTWRRSSTATKAGAVGGLVAVLALIVLVPVLLLSGGNKAGGEAVTPGGTGKPTRLEFVNTLLTKSGNRRVDSLEPSLDRSGGGNVANLGAASKDRQGRVFVHNALGGRFDHDWWVKTFGDFRVEDFFDPTDNEMLNTNDATLRTGKWTYQCADGPITFVGSVVEAATSPTGRRLITLRRFGLFE